MARVIHATTMNMAIASPCLVVRLDVDRHEPDGEGNQDAQNLAGDREIATSRLFMGESGRSRATVALAQQRRC